MPNIKPVYLGIDPGQNGGIARLCHRDVIAVPMPITEGDIWGWLFSYASPRAQRVFAIIEKVHSMPKQGVSSTFKFGVSYGGLRMALVGIGVPFEEVTPQVWQKALSIPRRKKTETTAQWKNRLKAKAQQLFPRVEITPKTADALLIAEYCRRKHRRLL